MSIPDPIFEEAERLARQRRTSRSQLYVLALARLIDEDEYDQVTEPLDDMYADR